MLSKLKITRRELIAFLLGLLTFLAAETIYDWDNVKKSFREGFEEGYRDARK